ncbi:conserved hypothetical protein [Aminomonas paucivorans DSM 12260]|uniref:Uncharacterized protein n=1 Tax=Aminomonas paucivorans DSM 12260 TaxID=584708 RepID=E3CZM9_9BACT|nr:Na-translocating system protein MpsC family protein [Aminomonas paucivorans]EFQ24661.1 conserved hypothetical protein [Aminomonas paucivorans DSM 12260]
MGILTPGDLKQELMRINNAVNQEMFGVGLRRQKVDLLDDRILLMAQNPRVKALTVFDSGEGITGRLMDLALLEEYKKRLRKALEDRLGVQIRSVLKDYDPAEELAFTLVVLCGTLEDLLRGTEQPRSAG